MLVVLSALVAGSCVLASACRLAWVVLQTWLDPQLVFDALSGPRRGSLATLEDAVAACKGATWERDLLAALVAPDESARAALVSEQLRELDWRTQRWSRVPRVCASVATSVGLLLACVAIVRELGQPTPDSSAALVSALDAFAIGMAATSFCVAVHVRARRAVSQRLGATQRLVERLESLAVAG